MFDAVINGVLVVTLTKLNHSYAVVSVGGMMGGSVLSDTITSMEPSQETMVSFLSVCLDAYQCYTKHIIIIL